MKKYPKIYTFKEALVQAENNHIEKLCNKGIRLLLGNGFSKAYFGNFGYKTLFDAIKNEKDNERIKELFEYFGTSNFEAILSFLKHAIFLAKIYDFADKEIVNDYEKVRDALASAIVKVHPENTNEIPEVNKLACYQFLSDFDDVFTVNYDLLLYWVLLQDPDLKFGDYFSRDDGTSTEYCEYFQDGSRRKKHVYFLHGALHLFLKDGITTKKVWGNTVPLIKQIKSEIENDYYPLVVAEGDSKSKKDQIKSNPYLNHSYSTLCLKKGQLFTFGFSFSEQDDHIIEAIGNNTGLKFLWIGIRGDFSKEKNQELLQIIDRIKSRRKLLIKDKDKQGSGNIAVNFFDTGDLEIWGKLS